MTRPHLLELCCGVGGAGFGYWLAGFDVTGVDIADQPRYPFPFIRADALAVSFRGFDAVHVSAPCQLWSGMTQCRPGLAEQYPDLITPAREMLDATGLPYVMENVVGAPLRPDLMLCGQMFGRELYRHRLFESNVPLTQPAHPRHVKPASKAGHWRPGTVMSISGHVAPVKMARELMGIDWSTREELAEAIPPYYTEHVGRDLLTAVEGRMAA